MQLELVNFEIKKQKLKKQTESNYKKLNKNWCENSTKYIFNWMAIFYTPSMTIWIPR